MDLAVSDTAEPGIFQAIYEALDGASRDVIGMANPRLMVIPIRDADGAAIGGLWSVSLFRWLKLEMLFVPETMRRQGVGSALIARAETEARVRGCIGIQVETLSFQAGPFYERLGFSLFGMLDDSPPGHQRLFFQKRLIPVRVAADSCPHRHGPACPGHDGSGIAVRQSQRPFV